ncbi:MAG TPA: cytochrome c [Candidatus Binatia bacterium]
MMHRRLFQALFLTLAVVLIVPQAFAQQDVIEKRQKLMKGNGADAKAIKGALESKDYATIETKAKDIGNNMDKVNDLFPKGSTSDKSRALPAIWEKWDDFSKHPGQVKKAANDVAAAAKAKDDAALPAKVKALGDACGSCHKNFRAEEKKG